MTEKRSYSIRRRVFFSKSSKVPYSVVWIILSEKGFKRINENTQNLISVFLLLYRIIGFHNVKYLRFEMNQNHSSCYEIYRTRKRQSKEKKNKKNLFDFNPNSNSPFLFIYLFLVFSSFSFFFEINTM